MISDSRKHLLYYWNALRS